nr:hypothetical protein [Actinomycetota bacterium]
MLAALLAATVLTSAPEVLFRFADPVIAESSALVAAPDGGGVWTAGDSGDPGRWFDVDRQGRTRAVHPLRGVVPVDVEDGALGPTGALVLADIGDNAARRRSVALHETRPGGATRTTVLRYADGPHDAEALLLHPRTGQTLVVTKELLGARAYEARDGVLEPVAPVAVRATGTPGGPAPNQAAQLLVTGGAVSPDGRRLALRTYTDAYVYEVPGDDLVAALRSEPRVLPLPATPQGEAVTWTRDRSALLTSSEGVRAPVHRVPVPGPPAAAAPPPSSPGQVPDGLGAPLA